MELFIIGCSSWIPLLGIGGLAGVHESSSGMLIIESCASVVGWVGQAEGLCLKIDISKEFEDRKCYSLGANLRYKACEA